MCCDVAGGVFCCSVVLVCFQDLCLSRIFLLVLLFLGVVGFSDFPASGFRGGAQPIGTLVGSKGLRMLGRLVGLWARKD